MGYYAIIYSNYTRGLLKSRGTGLFLLEDLNLRSDDYQLQWCEFDIKTSEFYVKPSIKLKGLTMITATFHTLIFIGPSSKYFHTPGIF